MTTEPFDRIVHHGHTDERGMWILDRTERITTPGDTSPPTEGEGPGAQRAPWPAPRLKPQGVLLVGGPCRDQVATYAGTRVDALGPDGLHHRYIYLHGWAGELVAVWEPMVTNGWWCQ